MHIRRHHPGPDRTHRNFRHSSEVHHEKSILQRRILLFQGTGRSNISKFDDALHNRRGAHEGIKGRGFAARIWRWLHRKIR